MKRRLAWVTLFSVKCIPSGMENSHVDEYGIKGENREKRGWRSVKGRQCLREQKKGQRSRGRIASNYIELKAGVILK